MSGTETFDVDTGQFTVDHFSADQEVPMQFIGGRGVSEHTLNSNFYSSFYILSGENDFAPDGYVAADLIDVTNVNTSYDSFNLGLYKDGNNAFFFDLNVNNFGGSNEFNVAATRILSGTKTPMTEAGPFTWSAPFRFAALLDGNDLVGLVRQNGVWLEVIRQDISAFISLPAGLAGYKPGLSHWSPSFGSSTQTYDNMQWGPNTDITAPPEFFPFRAPLNLTLDNLEHDEVAFHWSPSEENL